MAYIKQNFRDGAVLTGQHMSNIEDAISFNYTVKPLIELGNLTTVGEISAEYFGCSYYRTAKYLKPLITEIKLCPASNIKVNTFVYDHEFSFVEMLETTQCAANEETTIDLPEKCGYIKFVLTAGQASSGTGTPVTDYVVKDTGISSTGTTVTGSNIQRYNYTVTSGGPYKASGAYSVGVGIVCFGDGVVLAHFTPKSPFTDYEFIAPAGTKTIAIAGTTSTLPSLYYMGGTDADSLPSVAVNGVDCIEYFNIRSADEGYQRLVIPVNVAHPSYIDIETTTGSTNWSEIDSIEILPDYGLLALPKTYSNIGKPTRLIIYAHGAAINYAEDVVRFDPNDCQPEYWLAEGYAVMDIEGNPYNNVDEHFWIPQARQCYENAYNWIVNNYNICTDGIFLGGRSMGGGMCLDLVNSNIPILAICPVAPATNGLWLWTNYDSSRKKFILDHMGLPTADRPALSSANMTDAEWDYIAKYWTQFCKYTPQFRVLQSIPDKDQLITALKGTAWNTPYVEAEAALYADLRTNINKPIKFFCAYQDSGAIHGRNIKMFYKMCENANEICELRLFNTDETTDPHHFEFLDSRAYINKTTIYGETVRAPLVYVEMLQFWRRYEKTL